MTLADTNFWLAFVLSDHKFHKSAKDWFSLQATDGSVLFCRSTQQSFLRLLCTESVTRPYGIPPIQNAAAWQLYENVLADHRVGWAKEPDVHEIEIFWKRFATGGAAASPKLWMDAYLAAFAIAGGHRFVTTDKGFRQFAGLDVIVLD